MSKRKTGMKNMVTVTCPYCHHEGDEFEVRYTPFASLANSSPYRNEDNAELQAAGEIECEVCHEKFLYRFAPIVKVEVAKRPEYS